MSVIYAKEIPTSFWDRICSRGKSSFDTRSWVMHDGVVCLEWPDENGKTQYIAVPEKYLSLGIMIK